MNENGPCRQEGKWLPTISTLNCRSALEKGKTVSSDDKGMLSLQTLGPLGSTCTHQMCAVTRNLVDALEK